MMMTHVADLAALLLSVVVLFRSYLGLTFLPFNRAVGAEDDPATALPRKEDLLSSIRSAFEDAERRERCVSRRFRWVC